MTLVNSFPRVVEHISQSRAKTPASLTSSLPGGGIVLTNPNLESAPGNISSKVMSFGLWADFVKPRLSGNRIYLSAKIDIGTCPKIGRVYPID